jgi:hypothetical protein
MAAALTRKATQCVPSSLEITKQAAQLPSLSPLQSTDAENFVHEVGAAPLAS